MQSDPSIVIFGASGQLGSEFANRLQAVSLTRNEVDLTDATRIHSRLTRLQPNMVFNCAAYNFVDRAEDEPEMAFAVNALAPRQLALACASLDATLVHFSSDYVFGVDNNRKSPYIETDTPGPLSVYGQSKLTGEHFVSALCPKHFIIRTCGLYGKSIGGGKGTNFIEAMLRLARKNQTLRVVNDQICTPSYVCDVADAALEIVRNREHGLYHLTNSGQCSWFDLASEIFAQSDLKVDVSPISTKEYGSKALRPSYSVLGSSRNLPPLRSWQEALEAYLHASV